MGRLKFEQKFGQKLQDREIKPSEGSWEKLQGKLDAEEKKGSLFPYRWISVAACVVGGIFIWSLAFDSEDINQSPEVVDTPSKEILIEEAKQTEEKRLIVSEDITPQGEGNSVVEQSREEIVNTSSTKETAIAVIEKEKRTTEEPAIEVQSPPRFEIEQDLIAGMEEVIAEVATEEGRGAEVTDAEIEAMLENAAAELALEHHAEAVANNIDAGSLLWEIEMEMERSFRDKILNILKEGYSRTRTAVANQSF